MVPALMSQRRASFSGFSGLDHKACLRMLTAYGLNHTIAAAFLPYWEAGLFEGAEEVKSATGETSS